jgi:hypothetical protein
MLPRLRLTRLLPPLLCVLLLALAQTPARAATGPVSTEIQGVWSFNGGRVAIQRQTDGSYTGTVVAATKFAECPHPIGELMWTGIRIREDGSYWGLHQWFYEGAGCVLNPQLGPTAWRVLSSSTGAHFLRACFSSPGTTQPAISSSGTSSGVTYGCVDSALVAPPPSTSGTAGFQSAITLPSAKSCFSKRVFVIHVRDPRNDPIHDVLVRLGSHSLRVRRHGAHFVSTIDLRGRPKGTFTVRIHVTTVLGHRLTGSRTYHTCVRARRSKRAR